MRLLLLGVGIGVIATLTLLAVCAWRVLGTPRRMWCVHCYNDRRGELLRVADAHICLACTNHALDLIRSHYSSSGCG